MSDDRVDPSGSTEAFQAFAAHTSGEPDPGGRSLSRVFAIGGVLAVLVVVAVVWLVATS
jgi:hypothetical protein